MSAASLSCSDCCSSCLQFFLYCFYRSQNSDDDERQPLLSGTPLDSNDSITCQPTSQQKYESQEEQRVEEGYAEQTYTTNNTQTEISETCSNVDQDNITTTLHKEIVLQNLEYDFGLREELIVEKILNDSTLNDINRDSLTGFVNCRELLKYINNSNLEKFLVGLRNTRQSHLAAFIAHDTGLAPALEQTDDWPIDDSDRKLINKLYVVLVEEMVTNSIVDELITAGCINNWHSQSIHGQQTKYRSNRELLEIIKRRSKKAFKIFTESVANSSQHLQSFLQNSSDSSGISTIVKINTENVLTEEQIKRINERKEVMSENIRLEVENAGRYLFVSEGNLYMIVKVEEGNEPLKLQSEKMRAEVNRKLTDLMGEDEDIQVKSLDDAEYSNDVNIQKEEQNQNSDDLVIGELQDTSKVALQDQHGDDKSDNGEQQDQSRYDKATVVLQRSSNIRRQEEEAEIKSVKLTKWISGVTVVNDLVYVVQLGKSHVSVYNSLSLTELPPINIPDIKNPYGLAGCSHNKTLYISDHEPKCIHRVNLTNNIVKRWKLQENYEPWDLSVTSRQNLLVTVRISGTRDESRVVEYTSEGEQVREIELDTSIRGASQTVQLSSDQFIICHGYDNCTLQRVCVINIEGQIITSYGEMGGGGSQLSHPLSITIDNKSRLVFVADSNNDRVLLFSTDLTLLGPFRISRDLKYPTTLYFDSSTMQLFVGEKSGRVVIGSF